MLKIFLADARSAVDDIDKRTLQFLINTDFQNDARARSAGFAVAQTVVTQVADDLMQLTGVKLADDILVQTKNSNINGFCPAILVLFNKMFNPAVQVHLLWLRGAAAGELQNILNNLIHAFAMIVDDLYETSVVYRELIGLTQ